MTTWNIEKLTNVFETSESYVVGNLSYPRVTTILNVISKPYLREWYGKYGTEYCRQIVIESMELGKIVHALIEDIFNEVSVDLKNYNEDVQGCLKAFTKWRQHRVIGYRTPEVFVRSQTYHYGGTLDFAAEIDNDVIIVDLKTSKSIYPEHFLQVSAYLTAFKEVTNVTPDFGAVLRLGRDGKYEYCRFSYQDVKKIFPYFLSALKLWEWQNKNWNAMIEREEGDCCDKEVGNDRLS